MKEILKKIIRFLANPRLILCWSIAWFITNGWSYLSFAAGTHFDIAWLTAFAGGYIAFLWLPVSPEKIITAAIALVLLRVLFPNDKKTLGILKKIRDDTKDKMRRKRKKRKQLDQSETAKDETVSEADTGNPEEEPDRKL